LKGGLKMINYKIIPFWIMSGIFCISLLLIHLNYIIIGVLLLIAFSLLSLIQTERRAYIRKKTGTKANLLEVDTEQKYRYIDLVYSRGNVYKIYKKDADAIMDTL